MTSSLLILGLMLSASAATLETEETSQALRRTSSWGRTLRQDAAVHLRDEASRAIRKSVVACAIAYDRAAAAPIPREATRMSTTNPVGKRTFEGSVDDEGHAWVLEVKLNSWPDILSIRSKRGLASLMKR